MIPADDGIHSILLIFAQAAQAQLLYTAVLSIFCIQNQS